MSPHTRARSSAGNVYYVEYILLMTFFALPVCAACLYLGFPLLRLFRFAQLSLAGPVP